MLDYYVDDFSYNGVDFFNFINLDEKRKKMVLDYRNHKDIRSMMLSSEEIAYDQHNSFIEGLKEDRTRLYFLLKLKGLYLGVTDYYNISSDNAFWGFHVNPELLQKSYGVLMEYMVLKVAFELLALKTLKCETYIRNGSVVKLHEQFGFAEESRNDQVVVQSIGISKMPDVDAEFGEMIQFYMR